jgi:hypothetical protein
MVAGSRDVNSWMLTAYPCYVAAPPAESIVIEVPA